MRNMRKTLHILYKNKQVLLFLRDMEASWPGPGFDLDRIDPDGDYCKANCRWLDKRQNIARANRLRFGMKYRTKYRA